MTDHSYATEAEHRPRRSESSSLLPEQRGRSASRDNASGRAGIAGVAGIAAPL